MKMDRLSTNVDYSTLFSILEEILLKLGQPFYLAHNIHVFTSGIYTLRNSFLEPFLNQVIQENTDIADAVQTRVNANKYFELSYKQTIYVILNFKENPKDVLGFINSINSKSYPSKDIKREHLQFYNEIHALHSATHNGQSSFNRLDFSKSFYYCYKLYKTIYPDVVLPVDFADAKSIDDYILSKFKDNNKSLSVSGSKVKRNLGKYKLIGLPIIIALGYGLFHLLQPNNKGTTLPAIPLIQKQPDTSNLTALIEIDKVKEKPTKEMGNSQSLQPVKNPNGSIEQENPKKRKKNPSPDDKGNGTQIKIGTINGPATIIGGDQNNYNNTKDTSR